MARHHLPYGPHPGALRTLLAMRLLRPPAARPEVRDLAHSPRRVLTAPFCDGTPHPDLAPRSLARRLLSLDRG